ncbi:MULTISPECIES: hypothetical protein [Burkholderia]|uniref:hypothetical protein n=1 Tax=Burkholderia TaxID=32008 RepID=UPI00158A6312|nr:MULTISPECIES: hypothetical protein [Burkholderia]
MNIITYRKYRPADNIRLVKALTGLLYGLMASLLPEIPIKGLPGNPAEGVRVNPASAGIGPAQSKRPCMVEDESASSCPARTAWPNRVN